MAHFAQIIGDKVTQVIVVGNDDCAGGTYPESEAAGQTFIASLGLGGEWKQTSYSASFRGAYAGIGFDFDRVNDVFVAPVVEEPAPE
jgi:hypothetical protein